MATNRLLANQKKAKVSAVPPSPVGGLNGAIGDRKIAGLPEERYHNAAAALDTVARATQHYQDKRLMGDMKKVAAHKIEQLNKAVGGGIKGKR